MSVIVSVPRVYPVMIMVVMVVIIRIVRKSRRTPEPMIAEPRIPEHACHTPIPRVIVSAPVPWVVISPISTVIPRVPPYTCESHRSVVSPWISVVIDIDKRVIRRYGDCRPAVASDCPDGSRGVAADGYCIPSVAEKDQACLLALCHKPVERLVRYSQSRACRFRPVVDSVLESLS